MLVVVERLIDLANRVHFFLNVCIQNHPHKNSYDEVLDGSRLFEFGEALELRRGVDLEIEIVSPGKRYGIFRHHKSKCKQMSHDKDPHEQGDLVIAEIPILPLGHLLLGEEEPA